MTTSPTRSRLPLSTLLAAYLLFGVFIVLESKLRQGKEARSSEAGAEDAGTTRLLGAAYGAGLLLLPIATALRRSRGVPDVVGPLVMLAAITLRVWAARTLGAFYTRTLRTQHDQPVVRSGPYRFVHHPGYLGTLLMWLGFGLCSRDWLIALLYSIAMGVIYARRIRAEESMLGRRLGDEYWEYMRATPGLVPGLRLLARGTRR